MNTVTPHHVVWKVRLVQADRGYVEAAWQFQRPVSQIAQLKNQVVTAVVKQTTGAPPKQALTNRSFTAVMAFSKSLEATRHGNRDKRELEAALRQNPEDVDVLLALTRIERAQRQYSQAKSYAERAQRLQPNRAAPWAELGRIAKAEGRTDDAVQLLEKARRLDATQPQVHMALADLHERAGNKVEASNAYREAGTRYGTAGDIETAVQAFDKAKKLTPRDAGILLQEGELYALAGQAEKAQNAYAAAKELTPNNAQVYQKLGELAQQVGEHNKAQVNFEKAVNLQPQHGQANLKLGDIYLKDGRPNEAIPHLQQAHKSLPQHVGAGKALGRAYTATEQHAQAQTTYEQLLDIAPEDPEVYTAYGDTFVEQGDYMQAQLQYKKAIAFDPDSSLAYKGLGITYKALGREDEATQAFTQAQKLHPHVPLPRDANVVHAGIVNFVESFPIVEHQDGSAKMAVVNMDYLVAKERFFRYYLNKAKRMFRSRRADVSYVGGELERSLAQIYTLIDPDQIEHVLASSTYRQMTSQDITNRDYLKELSTSLKADALLFYRIVDQDISESHVRFNVSAILFDQKRGSMWMNEAGIYYPRDVATYWNRPLFFSLGALALALLIYGVIYWLKGFGNLRVTIEQNKRKEVAYFTILLSKNSDKDLSRVKKKLNKRIKKSRNKKNAYDLQVNHSTYCQSMVIREAQFKSVHAGSYYVYLYGVLTDGTGEQIGNYQMVQEVEIMPKCFQKMVFDLRRHTRRMDFFVFSGSNVAVGAEIILNNQGQSRYIKDDSGASFDLGVGQHAFTIEYENAFYKEEVDIPDLQKNYSFTFDLPADT